MVRLRLPERFLAPVHAMEQRTSLDTVGRVLRPVARKLDEGRLGTVLRGDWLGHAVHPLAVDFPLGCWIGAGLLDLTGGRKARRTAQRLVGLGLLAAPGAVLTGLSEWSRLETSAPRRVGVVHAAGNGVVACLYWLSWRQRRRGHHLAGVVLGMVGGSGAMVTGYLGGHLSLNLRAGTGERGPSSDLTVIQSAADTVIL